MSHIWSDASKTLVPLLSLNVCITCPSCTDESLKPVSGDLSLRGNDIFAQKVNSEYSCVSCEVHQLTEMCNMQHTVYGLAQYYYLIAQFGCHDNHGSQRCHS